MKTAIITSKNELGQIVNEGKAILLNKMDTRQDQGFWELRLKSDMSTTHCRWVDNDKIIEGDL